MSELVEKLSSTMQPVQVILRPEATAKAFEACIQRGYVHVKFPGTRGGTELGVTLDKEHSHFSAADFNRQTGVVKLVGKLTLDYVPVKCIAEIDLATLSGQGKLEPIEAPVAAAGGSERAIDSGI